MSKQRITLYHADPWGNGCSCTWVYLPMWDGPIEYWLAKGAIATYDDGTLCTHYDGETLKPVSQVLAEAPLESFKIVYLDPLKTLMMNKILYVTRNSDIYKVNTETFETTSERDENIYAVMATEDGILRDFSGELTDIKVGDWMFVKNSKACKVEKIAEMLNFLRSEYTKNNNGCKISEPQLASDCFESY